MLVTLIVQNKKVNYGLEQVSMFSCPWLYSQTVHLRISLNNDFSECFRGMINRTDSLPRKMIFFQSKPSRK